MLREPRRLGLPDHHGPLRVHQRASVHLSVEEAMKDLLELIVLVGFVLAIMFVFGGEPDLWDKWHADAMEQGCEVKP